MPNAFDKFIAGKVGFPNIDSSTPFRDNPHALTALPRVADPFDKTQIKYTGGVSPVQAMTVAHQRDAVDPYARREALRARAPNVVPATHAKVMGMPSGFAEWARSVGPRGLMALFSPVGVIENKMMEGAMGMSPYDAFGAAIGDPEALQRAQQQAQQAWQDANTI